MGLYTCTAGTLSTNLLSQSHIVEFLTHGSLSNCFSPQTGFLISHIKQTNTFYWLKSQQWSDPKKPSTYIAHTSLCPRQTSFPVVPVSPQLYLYRRNICAPVKTYFWNILYMCMILWLICLKSYSSSSLPLGSMDHIISAYLGYSMENSHMSHDTAPGQLMSLITSYLSSFPHT